MNTVDRFDRWAQRSPVSVPDLASYRFLFAVATLFCLPDVRWISSMPASAFNPPFGPFRLLTQPPPEWALYIIQASLVVGLVALALGTFTRASSATVAATLLLVNGLNYSYGKIDHTILWIMVPLVLLFAGWGNSLSLDALRKPARVSAAATWPLRLLALMIGVSFAVAGLGKITTGWLEVASPTVAGYVLQSHTNASDPLAMPLAALAALPIAEVSDWVVVLIEVAVLASVASWRAFRVILALLCLFHAVIALTMNIQFGWNIIVYGAFITWSTLYPSFTIAPTRVRTIGIVVLSIAVGVGAFFWSASDIVRDTANLILVLVGAAAACLYLARSSRAVLARKWSRVA
jgi:uncharacterized membrane protein YphA (DoxX/SURF4 family)